MTNRPLRVFLCHSSNDKPAVRELYQKLRAEPWIQPWLDEEELYPGQDWNMEIEKAVEAADAIIVCLSKGSTTKEGYVQKEIKIALDFADYKPEGTVFIIPVRLEDCKSPSRLSKWQYADYFEDQRGRGLQRLLVSLKKRADTIGLKVELHSYESVKKTIEKKRPIVNKTQKPYILSIEKSIPGAIIPITLSLEESVLGVTKTIQYQVRSICWTCVGSGVNNGMPCNLCSGSGVSNKPVNVDLDIPPNTKNADKLEYNLGKLNIGSSYENIYLIASVAEHPFLKIIDNELHMEYPIPNLLAKTGGKIRIPYFLGLSTLELTIFSGSKSGQVYRLTGKGINSGNFYIKIIHYDPEDMPQNIQKLLHEIKNYSLENYSWGSKLT